MAKKDKNEKKEDKKEAKTEEKQAKKSGKKGLTMKGRMFLVCIILAGLIFLPTSMLVFTGMLPTICAFFLSIRRARARISTVAAMNFAGCVPFIFKLWSSENDFAYSFQIITDPMTIIVIYGAATLGYMIDWVVVGFVSSLLYQKAELRLKAIRARQNELVAQWGQEVAGNIQMPEE